jgi:putative endonuclease
VTTSSFRLSQHNDWNAKNFSGKYQVNRLVWYEQHETIEAAIAREKQLKKWNRAWKIELIEKDNPNWNDLAQDIEV